MKRTMPVFIASVLSFTLVANASAQVTWTAGFKGGVGFAKLTGDDTKVSGVVTDPGTGSEIAISGDFDGYRTGFTGGGFAKAQVHESFGIQIELLYAQKGGKGDFPVMVDGSPAGTLTSTWKVDYVEIPLLGMGSFRASEKAMIDLFAGPALAFKVSAKEKDEFGGDTDEGDVSDAFKSTDFGLAFGAGVTIAANERVNVILEGRYTLGLTKILEVDADMKTSAISIMGGVSFPLGRATEGS